MQAKRDIVETSLFSGGRLRVDEDWSTLDLRLEFRSFVQIFVFYLIYSKYTRER